MITTNLSGLLDLSVSCPNLESVTISNYLPPPNNQDIAPDDNSPVILPPSTVNLRFIGDNAARHILNFRGQNIESLRIDLLWEMSIRTQFIPLQQNAFPNLRKFTFASCTAVAGFVGFIQHHSDLEELHIEVTMFLTFGWRLGPIFESCRNLRLFSIEEFSGYPTRDSEEWYCAQELVMDCLADEGLFDQAGRSALRVVFDHIISSDPWPQLIAEFFQRFPDTVFPTLGPVPTLTRW